MASQKRLWLAVDYATLLPGASSGAKQGLYEAKRLEGRMSFTPNDNMVVNGYSQRGRRCDDLFRHIDVGARRRGVAGRVVVHQPRRMR